MKITVIGSGSIFFTRSIIKGMIEMPVFNGAELALVDIDPGRNDAMGRFAELARDFYGKNDFKISYSTDRREVLANSDYVITTMSPMNAHLRGANASTVENYGITEHSGQTAGPGMAFRVAYEVPLMLDVCKDIEELAPDAWVFNLVNPTNVTGTVVDRFTKLKTLTFCDAMYTPQSDAPDWSFGELIKIHAKLPVAPDIENRDRFKIKVGGINHCVWMTDIEFDGKSVWKTFKDSIKKTAEKEGQESMAYGQYQLLEIFDALPCAMGHTVEYVRYFQGLGGKRNKDYIIGKWDHTDRLRWTRAVWRDIDWCLEGKIDVPMILDEQRIDMLNYVIESMETGKEVIFPVNVRNEGRISNLPDDVLVELFGTFRKGGVDVPTYGKLPHGINGIIQQTVDYQELALEAAMEYDYEKLVRAVACDPLVMSLDDAKEITRELMAIYEPVMPKEWDFYWKDIVDEVRRDYLKEKGRFDMQAKRK